jgi:cellulose synthase/poly-beta-1,6-N-acetylglucosamine synthase-like glycosyltransferase
MAFLALAALLTVVYTYVGYPLLIAAWAKLAPRPIIGRDDFEPTVTICFAVHNGEAHLVRRVHNLQSLDYPSSKLQILAFSDGSTDDTERLLLDLAASDPRLQVLSSRRRLGKPAALSHLLRLATGEVLLMCDVRQVLSLNALKALVLALSDPEVGCVSGRLVLAGDTGAGMYWRYERLIRGSEARLGRMVGVSGSIYAVRRTEMPDLPCDVLLDDMFVPLSVTLTTGKRTALAESAEAHDSACDDEHEFVRKVRTLAGNYQLLAKMPWLLVPGKNPVWLQIVSHKILRLVCPWALLVLFAASGWIAFHHATGDAVMGTAWRTVFVAQGLFYIVALLGKRVGRLGALVRTFVVLNAAAVVGLMRFVRGSQAITW